MKKICILVLASRSSDIHKVTQYSRYGLYDIYVELFWVPIIQAIQQIKHIDCFLLYNSYKEVQGWYLYEKYLKDNVLFDDLLDDKINYPICMVPGILTKQLNAFKKLSNSYDVFWNCNLSSIPYIERLDLYIQEHNISYSGHYVFYQEVNTHLHYYRDTNQVKALLNQWPGRSFLGGSGFFLNRKEANYIVNLIDKVIENDILYIVNDLAIGLLMPNKLYDDYFLQNTIHGTICGRVRIRNSMTYYEYSQLLDKYKMDNTILDIRFEHITKEEILRTVHEFLYRN